MSQNLERPSMADPLDDVRRVLIVEDDADLAELLAHWLDHHSLVTNAITIATSMTAASEELADMGVLDLVLLDRRLPQGMGDELLSTITGEFDPIVLMITGVEPSEALIRLPITDYLVKPIDEATLIKRIALLEKLDAAGVISDYTDARKAALLEYHLDDPISSPLFRRFAARWDYDRLEIAIDDEDSYVYELYLGGDGAEVSVSVVGRLVDDPNSLIADGTIRQVGEVIESGSDHAWIDVNGDRSLAVPETGFAVCEFVDDTPERFVEPVDSRSVEAVARALEHAYR